MACYAAELPNRVSAAVISFKKAKIKEKTKVKTNLIVGEYPNSLYIVKSMCIF